MKNILNIYAFLVLLIGSIIISCDNNGIKNSNDIIPEKWQGKYESSDGWTLTILSTGAIYWTNVTFSAKPNGSLSDVRVIKGGSIIAPGVTGEWVYLTIDEVKRGVIGNFSPAVSGYKYFIGMGSQGISEVINLLSNFGTIFSPNPEYVNIPGFPENNDWLWVLK